jgi:hypothetical protein
MAEQESTVSALELAQTAVEQAYTAHDLVLELSSVLEAMNASSLDGPLVPLAFSLSRMADRALGGADIAHAAAIRVRDALDGGVQ